jgi:hypothetical protein
MTTLFLLGLICLIAGYDLLTIRTRGVDSSISRTVRDWGASWPLVLPLTAFAFCCLYGHFFL